MFTWYLYQFYMLSHLTVYLSVLCLPVCSWRPMTPSWLSTAVKRAGPLPLGGSRVHCHWMVENLFFQKPVNLLVQVLKEDIFLNFKTLFLIFLTKWNYMHQVKGVMVNTGSQWISHLNMGMNINIGRGLRFCISEKHRGDAAVCIPGLTFWVVSP